MSPQYHSASASGYSGEAGPLLFMVEDTGLVDLGGRAEGAKEKEGVTEKIKMTVSEKAFRN